MAPKAYPDWLRHLLRVWKDMQQRCCNPRCHRFADYGGRGISVCEEWADPMVFATWALDHGWHRGVQLDRIDNDGDYAPGNCRFVTPAENCRNRRTSKPIELCGVSKTVAEWSDAMGISRHTVYSWIRRYGERGVKERIYTRMLEETERERA